MGAPFREATMSTTSTPAALLPTTLTRNAAALKAAPWLLLFGRAALFAGLQALFALGFYLAGSPGAWEASANWWPLIMATANLICLSVLLALFRAEDRSYWELFSVRREHLLDDGLVMVGIFVLSGPISLLPNSLLAGWLFGDPQAVTPFLFRPLPMWAVYLSAVAFAVTQGLVELPLYFAYVMPRLFGSSTTSNVRPSWRALALSAGMLGLQHLTAPLLFDARYLLWRALMFLPFAVWVGLVLRWRPRLLPYLAAVHVLMDFATALMLLPVAY